MKRSVFAVAVFVLFSFVSTAQAGNLTLREAQDASIDQTFQQVRLFPHSIGPADCRRTSPMGFRCAVKLKGESRWALKKCRLDVKVTKDPEIEARLLSKKCRRSKEPFLSEGQVWRAVNRLVDPGYRSDENHSSGGSSARLSLTRVSVELRWGNEKRSCLQSFKVALIDGSPKANAGEAICTEGVAWPRSTMPGAEAAMWTKPLPETP